LLTAPGNLKAAVIVFVESGDNATGASGSSAYGWANDNGAVAAPGLPPTDLQFLGSENWGSARGRSSDVNLGAFALSSTPSAEYSRGIVTFTDQVQINGPLTIDLQLGIGGLGTTLSDPSRGSAVANLYLDFLLSIPNPFDFPVEGFPPLGAPIPLAARYFEAYALHDEEYVEQGYRIYDSLFAGPIQSDIGNFSFLSSSFVFDPSLDFTVQFIQLLFPDQPIVYDVTLRLTAEAECDAPNDVQCVARANAFSSASAKFTGDYVSVGGSTYPGLQQEPSAVPEPGSLALLGGGLLVLAMSKVRRLVRSLLLSGL